MGKKPSKSESEVQCIRQREKAYRDLYSASVSKVRQPVESFFNWINEKTQIAMEYGVCIKMR